MATSRLTTRRVEWRVQVGTSNKPGQGLVIFEASVSYIPDPLAAGGPRTAIPEPVAAVLDGSGYACTPDPANPAKAGERGVALFTTDSLGEDGGDWTWTARPQLRSVNGIQMADAVPAFSFAVPAGAGSLDLAEVQKVPASPGLGTEQALALVLRAEKAAQGALNAVEDTVDAAATEAVSTALANSGLVSGAVSSISTAETEEYRGGFIGENGRPTDLVFDKYGNVVQESINSWAPRLGPLIGVEKATGFSSTAAGGLVGENGRETDIVFDAAGRIIDRTIADWAGRIASVIGDQISVKPLPEAEPRLGLGRSLYVRDRSGDVRLQTSRSDQFLALGDSLTDGFPRPPYSSDGSDSWPGVLQSLLGKTVHNLAVQGQTADEIAIRAGSLVPYLMPEGGVIPASGSVAVTNPGQFIAWRTDRGWGDTGTLAGVRGRFARNGGQPLLFTRTVAGSAIPVATPQPWMSDGVQYSDATTMMMLGRNDVGWASTGTAIIDRVVAANVAVVESRTPIHPRFLVMGTLNSVGEYTNSGGWTTVTESNRVLSQMYPDNYLDIRSYLVHESIYDQGITPTADDLTRMSKDAPPTSIMLPGDGIHYTQATAATVAKRVHKELKSKGWAA